ncbi:MAG: hypothetical protein IOD12_06095 [Silvanigrellales bacterium]|nr:hypothetical protein [Silvanigrellales bacterium]
MKKGNVCFALCTLGLLGLLGTTSACGQDEGDNGGKGGGATGGTGFVGSKPTAVTGKLDKASATKNKDEFQKSAMQGNPVFQDNASLTTSGLKSGTSIALFSGARLVPLASTAPLTGTSSGTDTLKACSQSEGDAADADADGWAASLKMVYDCDLSSLGTSSPQTGAKLTSKEQPTFSFKLKGGTTVKDADDSKAFPNAGFSFSYDDFRMSISGLGGVAASGGTSDAATTAASATSFDVALNGSVVVTGDAKELKGQTALQTSLKVGDAELSRVSQWFDSTSKPDNTSDPTKSGSVSFSGFLQLFDDKGAETTLKVSTSGLTYAKSCGTEFGGYKAGTITYEAASGKVEYVFADCKGTLKFNGAAL